MKTCTVKPACKPAGAAACEPHSFGRNSFSRNPFNRNPFNRNPQEIARIHGNLPEELAAISEGARVPAEIPRGACANTGFNPRLPALTTRDVG
jgi:hypothetical protein